MYGPSNDGRSCSANIARLTIAPLFIAAGIVHLLCPIFFESVMPPGVPHPHLVIMLTGAAELTGATALFVPKLRWLAGTMLAVYTVCVYPANILHAVRDLSTGTGLGWAYHYPRLFAQPLICWWALAAGAWPAGARLRSSLTLRSGESVLKPSSTGKHRARRDSRRSAA